MCGIAGVFHYSREDAPDRALVERMTRVLAHRGPDDEGVVMLGPCGIGNRRLSIIDLATGHMPMASEDESVWITFNGEIYNYRELREPLAAKGHRFRTSSDTEVILHHYLDLPLINSPLGIDLIYCKLGSPFHIGSGNGKPACKGSEQP